MKRQTTPASGTSISSAGGRLLVALALTALACALALAAGARADHLFYTEFGSQGATGGQFNQPRDIAVNRSGAGSADQGDVYIADENNNRIQRFNASGHFVSAWGADVDGSVSGGTDFEICTDASECKVGVASGGNGAVAGNGTLSKPQSVAVDNDTGDVYVSDRDNRRINVYAGDGAFIRSFGFKVNETDGATGYEVCPATDVCKAGEAGSGAGQYGAGATANTFGITVSQADGNPATGRVFLADSGNRRVNTYDLDGTDPASFGSATEFGTNQPRKIAADSRGIVYASNSNNGAQIERYDSEDANGEGIGFLAPLTATNSAPPGPLLAASPISNATATSGLAVAADPDGAGPETDVLYVLRDPATGSTSVQQFGPANAPGLSTAPSAVDGEHAGATLGAAAANGLGLNDTGGRLYVSQSNFLAPHRVFIFLELDAFGSPTVTTGGVSAGENDDLVTLEGTVNPQGFKLTECRFEYGQTEKYGFIAPCTPAAGEVGDGIEAVAVSGQAELEQLAPGEEYHYRLVAANAGRRVAGEDATATAPDGPADDCDNAAIRAAQPLGAIELPGCMALELVSPPEKAGQPARNPTISADGERVAFRSSAALGGTPGNTFVQGNFYVASRGGSGWSTAPTAPPAQFIRMADERIAELNPDFSRWFQIAATGPQVQAGVTNILRGGLGESVDLFSQPLIPLAGGSEEVVTKTRQLGVSADFSHFYFRPGNNVSLQSGDPAASGAGADGNTYVASVDSNGSPVLELLGRDREGKDWGGACGARLGGIGPTTGPAPNGERNQAAISPDGSRVFLSARASQSPSGACDSANKLRILERVESEQGPWIGPLFSSAECNRIAPEPPCGTMDGSDFYQGASADQSRVFFTSNRQLASSDLDGSASECSLSAAVAGCDLYLHDSTLPQGERLIQISAGEDTASHPTVGAGANVLNGIAAISGDGTHVYFVAEAALTGANANGDSPSTVAGARNLYLYVRDADHPDGELVFVAALAAGDASELWGAKAEVGGTWRKPTYPVPVTGAGDVLFFQSLAPLGANDADGSRRDSYRYDSNSGELECISCVGAADSVAEDVVRQEIKGPAGASFAEEARWASEDGTTAYVQTVEALVPGDVNGEVDIYLWREGELYRLPGAGVTLGRDAALSHDGAQIAFPTPTAMLAVDRDTAADVYIARADGGYPEPAPPPPGCEPDGGSGCQGEARAAPPSFAVPSETPGDGDPDPEPNRCTRFAIRAQRQSRYAKRLRRSAARAVSDGKRRQATRLRRRSRGAARQAKQLSRKAKRCRRASRRAAR